MISTQTAKLKWQCRRGMLELDLLLEAFIPYLSKLSTRQLASFEKLLSVPDPMLYDWLMSKDSPKEKELIEIVTLIQLHANL